MSLNSDAKTPTSGFQQPFPSFVVIFNILLEIITAVFLKGCLRIFWELLSIYREPMCKNSYMTTVYTCIVLNITCKICAYVGRGEGTAKVYIFRNSPGVFFLIWGKLHSLFKFAFIRFWVETYCRASLFPCFFVQFFVYLIHPCTVCVRSLVSSTVSALLVVPTNFL